MIKGADLFGVNHWIVIRTKAAIVGSLALNLTLT